MGKVAALQCVLCGRTFEEGQVMYTCPVCGGVMDVQYDDDALRAGGFGPESLAADPRRTHWRYQDLLPVEGSVDDLVTIPVGDTPVFPLPGLAGWLGGTVPWIKDEGRQPTGSFKDRASSVAAVKATQLGFDTVCCASTGNAASSLAGFAAHLGLRAVIFVPQFAPEPKLAQLLIFGAEVFVVEGTYEAAYDLSMRACEEFGWYNRNAAVNPVMVEGKKTCGFEIAEQMRGSPPDWVSVSVGDGCTVAGIWKGLVEMQRFGVIERLPRMLASQAELAAPLVAAFQAGSETWEPSQGGSLADSINVGEPRNGVKALRAVRDSGGAFVAVSDEEILEAHAALARQGVFGEPAGVAGIAGIRRAVAAGTIERQETVLHVVTGTGLKDVKSALRAAPRSAHRIAPDLSAVRAVVGSA